MQVHFKELTLRGLSHLAQNKKKNAETNHKMVAFFFFNRFSPTCGIDIQLRGEENGFCIEMRTAPFFAEKSLTAEEVKKYQFMKESKKRSDILIFYE